MTIFFQSKENLTSAYEGSLKHPGDRTMRRFVQACKQGFIYPTSRHDSIRMCVSMGRDVRTHPARFAAQYITTFPLQFLTEPILDTIGTPAWGNMVGTTRSMFHLQTSYISTIYRHDQGSQGGASIFFQNLGRFMRDHAKIVSRSTSTRTVWGP